MKLLFICKRHPQQRDLIENPYGRFYHLPTILASLGHEVRVQLGSHRRLDPQEFERFGVTWSSCDVVKHGLFKFYNTISYEAELFQPDWVVACSDIWCGLLAKKLSSYLKVKLMIDAYDNFEAYMPWNFPLHFFWRRVINEADLVTAAGPELARLMQKSRQDKMPVQIIPMSADPRFRKMDKSDCRQKLKLPEATPLIGYSGAWAKNRGTDILLDVLKRVRASEPNTSLVLTGRPPKNVCDTPGIISLGYLEDEELPLFLNAIDLACIITTNNSFGRYSYPAKLCEAMACGTPVVATDTEPVRWMLNDQKQFLAPVGDVEGITTRILENMKLEKINYAHLSTWEESGRLLDMMLSRQSN